MKILLIEIINWPISLPVGYMLRDHVNLVQFPDWPFNFFLMLLKIKHFWTLFSTSTIAKIFKLKREIIKV